MPWLLAAIALAAALAAALRVASKAEDAANVEKETLDQIIDRIGSIRGVDPDLLRAVASVESEMKTDAVRWKPPRDVSVGVMQILCVPPAGVQLGEDYVCQNRLMFADQWPSTFSALKDAELNVDLGAQILAENIRLWGFPRGVAMYNDYAARHASIDGPFPNDIYVKRVMYRLNQLKGKAA